VLVEVGVGDALKPTAKVVAVGVGVALGSGVAVSAGRCVGVAVGVRASGVGTLSVAAGGCVGVGGSGVLVGTVASVATSTRSTLAEAAPSPETA
jgi:hypothetical protein